ncbi:(2Fe-2S)-binding protein [Arsenicitalea aurantiaca]|nr:(2Fe-2S)-binding protein [Arsenicitalea aurantiaca]
MLVCHCNVIAEREIRQVIRAFLKADPWAVIVPAKIYRELGKRGRCCGCFPNVVDIITSVTEEYHLQIAQGLIEPATTDARPAARQDKRLGDVNERRSTGNRAA